MGKESRYRHHFFICISEDACDCQGRLKRHMVAPHCLVFNVSSRDRVDVRPRDVLPEGPAAVVHPSCPASKHPTYSTSAG